MDVVSARVLAFGLLAAVAPTQQRPDDSLGLSRPVAELVAAQVEPESRAATEVFRAIFDRCERDNAYRADVVELIVKGPASDSLTQLLRCVPKPIPRYLVEPAFERLSAGRSLPELGGPLLRDDATRERAIEVLDGLISRGIAPAQSAHVLAWCVYDHSLEPHATRLLAAVENVANEEETGLAEPASAALVAIVRACESATVRAAMQIGVSSRSAAVRQHAGWLAAAIGVHDAEVARRVVALLDDEDERVREAAAVFVPLCAPGPVVEELSRIANVGDERRARFVQLLAVANGEVDSVGYAGPMTFPRVMALRAFARLRRLPDAMLEVAERDLSFGHDPFRGRAAAAALDVVPVLPNRFLYALASSASHPSEVNGQPVARVALDDFLAARADHVARAVAAMPNGLEGHVFDWLMRAPVGDDAMDEALVQVAIHAHAVTIRERAWHEWTARKTPDERAVFEPIVQRVWSNGASESLTPDQWSRCWDRAGVSLRRTMLELIARRFVGPAELPHDLVATLWSCVSAADELTDPAIGALQRVWWQEREADREPRVGEWLLAELPRMSRGDRLLLAHVAATRGALTDTLIATVRQFDARAWVPLVKRYGTDRRVDLARCIEAFATHSNVALLELLAGTAQTQQMFPRESLPIVQRTMESLPGASREEWTRRIGYRLLASYPELLASWSWDPTLLRVAAGGSGTVAARQFGLLRTLIVDPPDQQTAVRALGALVTIDALSAELAALEATERNALVQALVALSADTDLAAQTRTNIYAVAEALGVAAMPLLDAARAELVRERPAGMPSAPEHIARARAAALAVALGATDAPVVEEWLHARSELHRLDASAKAPDPIATAAESVIDRLIAEWIAVVTAGETLPAHAAASSPMLIRRANVAQRGRLADLAVARRVWGVLGALPDEELVAWVLRALDGELETEAIAGWILDEAAWARPSTLFAAHARRDSTVPDHLLALMAPLASSRPADQVIALLALQQSVPLDRLRRVTPTSPDELLRLAHRAYAAWSDGQRSAGLEQLLGRLGPATAKALEARWSERAPPPEVQLETLPWLQRLDDDADPIVRYLTIDLTTDAAMLHRFARFGPSGFRRAFDSVAVAERESWLASVLPSLPPLAKRKALQIAVAEQLAIPVDALPKSSIGGSFTDAEITRWRTFALLSTKPINNSETRAAIRTALVADDAGLRRAAIDALIALKTTSAWERIALVGALEDPSPSVRLRAAEAARELLDVASLRPTLEDMLANEVDAGVRGALLAALAR